MCNDFSFPLVSIVTPSFNQGPFIRETIQSVLTQNYPNLEYWVIDGGSTDETIAILKEYETDSRFHWVSEKDRGQGDAINKGWLRCKGPILAWLNSDDTYRPGAILAQVQALQAQPEVGVVYGDTVYIDEQSQVVGRYHTRPFDKKRLLHVPLIGQPSAFFRRNCLEKSGFLDLRFQYALDYDLFLRLLPVTQFLYQPIEVATYRIHQQTKTTLGFRPMTDETVWAIQRICRQNPTLCSPAQQRRAISDWYWNGALRSLEEGSRENLIRFILLALQTDPLRPRMGMFLVKICDKFLQTNFAEQLTCFLDKKATNQIS